MGWLLLSLDLEALDPETVERSCQELGALSVTLSDAGDEPVLEPLPGTTPMWKHIRLSALFAGDSSGDHLRSRLASLLDIDRQRIGIDPLADRNWSEEWRKGFQPLCFGSRLWICPGGQRPERPGSLVIDLDPGLAFGTGSHPSTALCLEWLCGIGLRERRLIDYGCGSGILSLAAARLGAREVVATDIDPQALLATRENAGRNGLSSAIRVFAPGELPDDETDILVANILANPLRDLAPQFARLVRSEGVLTMAGILEEQVASVHDAFEPDFELAQVGQREGWAILSGHRRLKPR